MFIIYDNHNLHGYNYIAGKNNNVLYIDNALKFTTRLKAEKYITDNYFGTWASVIEIDKYNRIKSTAEDISIKDERDIEIDKNIKQIVADILKNAEIVKSDIDKEIDKNINDILNNKEV